MRKAKHHGPNGECTCFDIPSQSEHDSFMEKIRARKPVTPPELHKQLKSYREWSMEYNSK